MRNDGMGDPRFLGMGEARRPFAVADDKDDLGGIERIGRGADQRRQVRPASGNEDAELQPRPRAGAARRRLVRTVRPNGVLVESAV
jgi:hypothetical protein